MSETGLSETVFVYDYSAGTNIVISVFVPNWQVLEFPALFLVDPVFTSHVHSVL